MKKHCFLVGLFAVLASVCAGVAEANPPVVPHLAVTNHFYAAQIEKSGFTDKEAIAAAKGLNDQGYFVQENTNHTNATLLEGGCGFAGCIYTYLVTTEYHRLGANPQARVVAGIVAYYSFRERNTSLKKVLTNKDISELQRQN